MMAYLCTPGTSTTWVAGAQHALQGHTLMQQPLTWATVPSL
jgi:hypothetical protein